MIPAPPRNALAWLARQPEFRALAERSAQLLALQGDLRRYAPARALTALGLDGDTLVVATEGAAAAAKLRQIEPSLVAHLAGLGWPVRRVRIRPRPTGAVAPAPEPQARAPIPDQALDAFDRLSEGTSNPALKEALAHLLEKRRRGRR